MRIKFFIFLIVLATLGFLNEYRHIGLKNKHLEFQKEQVDQLQYIQEGLKEAHIKALRGDQSFGYSYGYFNTMFKLHILSLKGEVK